VILGTLTSTFINFDEIEISFHSLKLLFVYNICLEEFFHRSVSNGTGEGGNFEEKHRKNVCFFEKKTFQLLICFRFPRSCFVFFSDLNFELFG